MEYFILFYYIIIYQYIMFSGYAILSALIIILYIIRILSGYYLIYLVTVYLDPNVILYLR